VNIDGAELTAQERLAISRRALLEQWHGSEEETAEHPDLASRRPRRAASSLVSATWLPVARSVAQRWWRDHPANAAAHLALPVLERVAREQPLKLVAGAAVVGALVVLVKPWRLLSVTALGAALFKTSDIAGVVTTLMQRRSNPTRKEPR